MNAAEVASAALPLWLDAVLAALVLLGAAFALVGSWGLAKLSDFLKRLHGPTKATTLGVGGVLLASMVASAAQGTLSVAELLITLFIFVTAPVSANLLAQAALHRREASVAPPPKDQPLP